MAGHHPASAGLAERLGALLDERRACPRDDLISELAVAEVDGHGLTDDEILAFLRLLLPAGAETTFRVCGSLLSALLDRPEHLRAVRDDRSLLPAAIEEALRWEAPMTYLWRVVEEEATIGPTRVPRGAVVDVCLGSANHDETRWHHPEDFDLYRPRRPHVAFAHGPHTCVGMHLARLETEIAVGALLDRLPDLRYDPELEPPGISGLLFRAPAGLPVVFA